MRGIALCKVAQRVCTIRTHELCNSGYRRWPRHRSFHANTHSGSLRRTYHVCAENSSFCATARAPSESDAPGTPAASVSVRRSLKGTSILKKMIAAGLMGLGFVAAQGCMAEQGTDEQAGVATGELAAACNSMQGINTTKASLAVAMGIELGRWDTINDLQVTNNKVTLKSTAVCVKNNCANTKAILGQQDFTADQNVF